MSQDSQIVNERKFFSMEKVQLINAEEMTEIESHHFPPPLFLGGAEGLVLFLAFPDETCGTCGSKGGEEGREVRG